MENQIEKSPPKDEKVGIKDKKKEDQKLIAHFIEYCDTEYGILIPDVVVVGFFND